MTKEERAYFKKTLGIVDRKIKALDGGHIILGNQLDEIRQDIKGLTAVLVEMQAQQRRASGNMRVANVKAGTPRKPRY